MIKWFLVFIYSEKFKTWRLFNVIERFWTFRCPQKASHNHWKLVTFQCRNTAAHVHLPLENDGPENNIQVCVKDGYVFNNLVGVNVKVRWMLIILIAAFLRASELFFLERCHASPCHNFMLCYWRIIKLFNLFWLKNYSDVIMGAMASKIIGVSIVYSTACSDADRRKHQSSVLLAFVRGIRRWPVNYPHKGPVTRKLFHLMTS